MLSQLRNKCATARMCCMVVAGSTLAFAAPLENLTVRGTDIVNARGEVVPMRGINFGGWLMMETWIPSIEMEWHDRVPKIAEETGILDQLKAAEKTIGEFVDDVEKIGDYLVRLNAEVKKRVTPAQYDAYMALLEKEPPVNAALDMDRLLRKRFGDIGAAQIWDAHHDTWITETDFQLAKALGFNFVRVPFWYRWFEHDDAPYTYFDYGFGYLDKAVRWAANHGLYILLDLHGAPGCQSPWDHTGELSRGEFFLNEEFQKRAAALWRAIALRYKDDPTVWGYDLLNEPYSARGLDDWTRTHDLMYDAIREVDPDTIIVMEDGYKLEEKPWVDDGFFPDPKALGWTNVVYSIHFYSGADPEFTTDGGLADHEKRAELVVRIGSREQDRCKVPMYWGEFSTMGNHPNDIAGMRFFLNAFNKKGWAWSPWTWKYVNDDGVGSIWGVYQFLDPWPHIPNMHRDSKEKILEVIARTKTKNFRLIEPYAAVIRECTAQPGK
ncbi:MAG: cellulase family glycosylhydrolase [Candidatus Hydrogenedentes bacterium]|nr:cellulase family glycosylhydrolase [Candidatus Hydrogenedentota bacterium]